jgi:hypothetical protein
VDEQPQPAETRFPFQPRDEIVRKRDPLQGGSEHEFARVQDECLVALDLDELRQVLLLRLDVDVRVAGIAENAEVAVDPHVERRRLHEVGLERLDADAPVGQQLPDRPVGQDHAAILRPSAL